MGGSGGVDRPVQFGPTLQLLARLTRPVAGHAVASGRPPRTGDHDDDEGDGRANPGEDVPGPVVEEGGEETEGAGSRDAERIGPDGGRSSCDACMGGATPPAVAPPQRPGPRAPSGPRRERRSCRQNDDEHDIEECPHDLDPGVQAQ